MSPACSATPTPTIATMMSPTAVKPMKLGINVEYMNRSPSMLRRLRPVTVVVSTTSVTGSMVSKAPLAPVRERTCDTTITMPISARKMIAGCGTLLPTRSTTSSIFCIMPFETGLHEARRESIDLLMGGTCGRDHEGGRGAGDVSQLRGPRPQLQCWR